MENKDFNPSDFLNKPIGRMGFLKYSGAVLATGLFLGSCKKDKIDPVTPPTTSGPSADDVALGTGNPVKLSGGDIGILQYAYGLEILEAAFYTQVMATSSAYFTGATVAEQNILADIQKHEVCHREFFKAALGSNANIFNGATPDFSTINFNDRNSVLTAAKTFEDLGVSAYNGAARFIVDPGYLTLAGKIVSVEARHAAAIRDLLLPRSNANGSFAGDDVVTSDNGLDVLRRPKDVIPSANTYLAANSKIDATSLPR